MGSRPKTLPSQVSVDTNPLPEFWCRPSLSGHVSADALAGPVDARMTVDQKARAARDAAGAGQQGEATRSQYQAESKLARSSSSHQQQMDQIGSEMKKMSFQSFSSPKSSSSDKGDSSYGSLTSCSSLPSDDWEDELKQYMNEMPSYLKMGYIDVLILYCEEDRAAAEKFRDHLKTEIELENGPIEAMLYDAPELTAICGSHIQHLAKGVERSTYVFIFMTKNFVKDKWCEFSSESCLMEAITNPEKQWCVVPVYTEKRNTSFRVPMGLNTLKGINYYNNDRFYRNGVARLIGDKICVRKQKNEQHKILQKKMVEEIKRNKIKLIEDQRRIQAIEEARTVQLIDWLDHETKRLIRDGILPSELFHSYSESDLSSSESSFPHSVSTGSLKPVQTQNTAVASYFQQMVAMQKTFGRNEANYSSDQIHIIERMYGSMSPQMQNSYYQTQNLYGDHQMLAYPRLPMSPYYRPNCEIQGNHPPVPQSAAYAQGQHAVKRSTSQASADMGPSTEFVLRTEQGNVSVAVPNEIYEKIKHSTESEQQHLVSFFLEEREKSMRENASQSNHNSLPQNQPMSSVQGGGVPNFSVLGVNPSASYSSVGSAGQSSMPVSLQAMSNHVRSFTGQASTPVNSMDANRSNHQGNVPNISMLNDTDGGNSLQSKMNHTAQQTSAKQMQQIRVDGRQVKAGGSKEYKEEEGEELCGDSEEEEAENDGRRLRKKTVMKKIIYNIYQPGAVVIGENNVINQGNSDVDESSDGSDSVGKSEEDPPSSLDKRNSSPEPASNGKKMDIKPQPGAETRYEIGDQPEATRSTHSCMPDAAPSTHQPGAQYIPIASPQTSTKLKGKIEAKEAEDVKTGAKSFQQNTKKDKDFEKDNKIDNSSKFEESDDENIPFEHSNARTLEGSVNLNSTMDSSKSSGSQKVILPVTPFAKQEAQVKAQEKDKLKPTAAVSPFSAGGSAVNENCDYTDPKTVVQSEQTYRKKVVGASNITHGISGQELHASCANGEIESTDQNQLEVAEMGERGKAKFTGTRSHMTDPRRLFYHNQLCERGDIGYNVDDKQSSVSLDCCADDKNVELGEDSLSAGTSATAATSCFDAQTANTNLEDFDVDKDFEVLDTDCPASSSTSFEESGSLKNKRWQGKGTAPKDKDCCVS